MKRTLASLFRWLEDRLDPSRRNLLAQQSDLVQRVNKRADEYLDRASELAFELDALRREQLPLPLYNTDWSTELRAGMVDFLKSVSGKAAVARGRLIQHQLLVGSDTSAADPIAARSWCQCLDWLESLSRASARSTEATAPDTDQSPDHDTPRTGESVLRERMSP